jgi:hypothetical protein
LFPVEISPRLTGETSSNTMSELNTAGAWAASAVLTGITLIPLGTFWGFSLRKCSGQRTQAAKMARIFLQIALPVWIM